LFDITGKSVGVIQNSRLEAGHYDVSLKTDNFTSGVYFVMLSGNNNFDSKKIVVVK